MIDIQIIERSGHPWSHPTPVRFGPAGGVIGRGADCQLLLDDPDRRISRQQAAIVRRDGCYLLRQLRQTCPVEIHGRLLMTEEEAELAVDDEIRIGPYTLRVVAIDPDSLEAEACRAPIAEVAPGLASTLPRLRTRFFGRERELQLGLAHMRASPVLTLTGIGEYTVPLGGGDSIDFVGSASYRSKVFFDPANDPLIVQDGHWVLDAHAAYVLDDGKWEFAVFGHNLGDEKYLNMAFDLARFGLLQQIVGRCKTFYIAALL